MSSHEISNTEKMRRLKRMRAVALLMDSQYNLLGIKFGLDSLLGLVPWLGDFIAGVISAYVVWEAYKMGVPKEIIRKMTANVLVDVFVGGVPILGDIFDVLFKANKRNVRMVEEFIER